MHGRDDDDGATVDPAGPRARRAPVATALALVAALSSAGPGPRAEDGAAAPAEGPLTVAVLLFPDVDVFGYAAPAGVFAHAWTDRGAAFRIVTAGELRAPAERLGATIVPGHDLDSCPEADVILIPPGRAPVDRPEVVRWLRERATRARVVMSVSGGAALLARAGLLDGRTATMNEGNQGDLEIRAPRATVVSGVRVTENDGDPAVVTSGAVGTGVDAALVVIARLLGPAQAEKTARAIDHPFDLQALRSAAARPAVLHPRHRIALRAVAEGPDAALAVHRSLPADERPGVDRYWWACQNFEELERPEDAVACYAVAARAHPDSAWAHALLAGALEQAAEADGAVREARSALELLESDPAPAWQLARARATAEGVIDRAGGRPGG